MLVENSERGIARAAEVLRCGGLVAFPTETVYGLGADASSRGAVARIFAAKGRPPTHPLIVHLSDASALDRWARDIPSVAWRLAASFWPGPLTLILRRAPGVLDAVTGGQDTVGLRVPAHPAAQALLESFGRGVAAPSANRFGRLSPTAASHVVAEMGSAVDCIIEGGACAVGIESTILDISGERPRLLRPGALSAEELAGILGELPEGKMADAPRVPGEMASHYAPGVPVRLFKASDLGSLLASFQAAGEAAAVLSMSPPPAGSAKSRWWQMPFEPEDYARELYARLREADSSESCSILVERPPETGPWEAVRDRLERASTEAGSKEGELV
jgi:L-threonylcarbamoyladenylate synthase